MLIRTNPGLAWKCQQFFDDLRERNALFNERFFYTDPTRYIALLAHNEKKVDLIAFVRQRPVRDKPRDGRSCGEVHRAERPDQSFPSRRRVEGL
jgi:hypothetical protein